MEALVTLAVLVVLLFGMPRAVRAMKHWLRHSRTGGFVGSLGAGIATQLDPAQAMRAAEMEKELARKGAKVEDEP